MAFVTILQENKKLAEPLKKAREELTDLKRQLGSQEKQKGALVAARTKLKVCDKDIENLKWELEVLQQKYDRAVSEFGNLNHSFIRRPTHTRNQNFRGAR